jgi:putative MATE family efflux protein
MPEARPGGDGADPPAGPAAMPAVPASPPRKGGPSKVERLTEGRLVLGVLRFGAPLVVGMILHTAFNLVDMFMIGRLPNGTEAVAAVGICDMVAAVATILANGISTASVAIVSRRAGARFLTGVRRATWQSLLVVGALSVVFGLAGVLGSDFIIRDMMQAKGEAADLAVGYLQIMLGGCYSIFFLLQLTALLRALGHAKTAASLLVGGNLLNIVLNVFLIYGTGPRPEVFAWALPIAEALNVPRLGVEGAAWATLLGRSVPVLIGAVLLAHRRGGPRFHVLYLRPQWKEIRSLVTIGWPSSAQLVVRVGTVLVFISLINANYTTAGDVSVLTGYSICLRLETMALFVGMGWGAAASTYVGANLGAGHLARARRAGWIAALFNVALMALLTTIYLLWAGPIVGFFDPTAEVLDVGREYFGTVGLSYAFLGLGVVLSQAMTGAGATFSSMVIDTAVLLLLVVPAAILVTETFDLPRMALWLTIAMGNVVAATAYALYYGRGSFLHKHV